jgi:hypothetical protein
MNGPGEFWMSEGDVEVLRCAKDTLEHPGLPARIAGLLGMPIEEAMKRLPPKWSGWIDRVTEKSLMLALTTALATVESRQHPRKNGLHRILVGGTGAIGGFFGLPALAIELPVSTMVMLRSIADIGRSEGENLATIDAKLACIEVFALGGRTGSDDATESAYFTVRAALAKAMADAAKHFAARGGAKAGAPAVARLIAQVANRFGVIVTQKAAAQAVPVVGGAGGATVNVLFMKHFQDMAGGHFTVRRLERQYGSEVVRRAYERL